MSSNITDRLGITEIELECGPEVAKNKGPRLLQGGLSRGCIF
jgi:hypothetical protein